LTLTFNLKSYSVLLDGMFRPDTAYVRDIDSPRSNCCEWGRVHVSQTWGVGSTQSWTHACSNVSRAEIGATKFSLSEIHGLALIHSICCVASRYLLHWGCRFVCAP